MSGSFDWIGSIFGGGGGFAPVSGEGQVPAGGQPLASPEEMQQAGWDQTGGGTWEDPSSFASTGEAGTGAVDTGASGFGGGATDWSGMLKKAIGGLSDAAKKNPAPAENPFPLGRPGMGAAPQSRGQAPAGLANMIAQLQQRAQALRGQYLAPGNLPPRGPGGGLLGM